MDLTCPTCGYATAVSDSHLPPEGTRARCPSCARVSVYYRGGLVDDMPTPPQPMEAVATGAPPAPGAWPERSAPPTSGSTTGPNAAVTSGSYTGPRAAAGTRWTFKTPAGKEGPYDVDTVKNLVRTHSLHPDDEAQVEGETTWMRAGDVPALARYFRMRAAAPAPAAAGPATCFKHPSKPGKWHCTGCGTLTCDACIVEQEMGRMKVKVCPRCAKAATPYVPSKVIVPFWKDIKQVLLFPLKDYAWIALFICPVFGALADIARPAPMYGKYAWCMLMLPVYAYHLFIIRSTSRGGRGLPNLGNVANYKDDLVAPGAKASFVTFILFVGPYLLTFLWVMPAWFHVAEQKMAVSRALAERDEAEAEKSRPKDEDQTAQWASDDESSSGSEKDQAWAAYMEEMNRQRDESGGGGVKHRRRTYENVPETDWNKELLERRKELRHAQSSAGMRSFVLGVLVMAVLTMLPLALIVVALFNTVAPVFQPQLMFRIIREIQQEYSICTVVTLSLFLCSSIVAIPLLWKTRFFFGPEANPLSYYCTFVAFYVMGRTAEMAEQKIDWA